MAACFAFLPGPAALDRVSLSATAYAQDWRAEFDDICKQTDNSMSLSKDELKQLIARCDKLKAVIGTLEETEKKVFMKRLKLCQELLIFALDSKEKEQK